MVPVILEVLFVCIYVVVLFVLAYESFLQDYKNKTVFTRFATDLRILKTHRILPCLKLSLKASTLM